MDAGYYHTCVPSRVPESRSVKSDAQGPAPEQCEKYNSGCPEVPSRSVCDSESNEGYNSAGTNGYDPAGACKASGHGTGYDNDCVQTKDKEGQKAGLRQDNNAKSLPAPTRRSAENSGQAKQTPSTSGPSANGGLLPTGPSDPANQGSTNCKSVKRETDRADGTTNTAGTKKQRREYKAATAEDSDDDHLPLFALLNADAYRGGSKAGQEAVTKKQSGKVRGGEVQRALQRKQKGQSADERRRTAPPVHLSSLKRVRGGGEVSPERSKKRGQKVLRRNDHGKQGQSVAVPLPGTLGQAADKPGFEKDQERRAHDEVATDQRHSRRRKGRDPKASELTNL